jgi:prepilin-type N-terminal cleavage/methylation domain-containing protein
MKVFSTDKGFTIIETMVAIAILAVGILGVGTMLMLSFSSGRFATETRRAESMGTQKLEELRAQNTRITPMTSGNAEDQAYVYRWVVAAHRWTGPGGTSTPSSLSQLDVTVGWPRGPAFPACTGANPENCKYRTAVTTFFKPQKF